MRLFKLSGLKVDALTMFSFESSRQRQLDERKQAEQKQAEKEAQQKPKRTQKPRVPKPKLTVER